MRLTFLIIATTGLILAGCAPKRTANVIASRPTVTNRSSAPADLKLDEIQPKPVLAATTRPATPATTQRAPLESLELFARARDAMLQNQRYTAINFLEKAIRIDPDSYQLRYWLGEAYSGSGVTNDSSIAAFEAGAAIEPDHIDVQVELGRQYLAKNVLPKALEHLRLAVQTQEYARDDESAAVADFYLAKALQSSGYDRAALDSYENLIDRLQAGGLSSGHSPELAFLVNQPESLFAQVGELFEKHGQPDEALKLYKLAASRKPDDFDYQAKSVRALLSLGRRMEASDRATDTVRNFRASTESLTLLKETYRKTGGDAAVAQELARLHREQPNDRSILWALVDVLSGMNRQTDAEELLADAATHTRYDPDLVRRLFALYDARNDVDAAARLLIESLAARPDSTRDLVSMWSQLLRPWRRNHLTVARLQAVTVSPPAEASKLYWISQLAQLVGVWNRGELARTSLEQSVKLVPPFPPAYRALQIQYWNRDDWDDARKLAACDQLAASLDRQGDDVLAGEIRGLAALNSKNPGKACDEFAKAIKAGGTSIDLRLEYAVALHAHGDVARAEQILSKLTSDNPTCEDAYTSLFQLYLDIGEQDRALGVLQRWLNNDPRNINAKLLQSNVLLQLGQAPNAEQVLLDLFEREPDNADVLAAMGDFYTRTRRIEQYITKLEAQRSAHPDNRTAIEQLVAVYAGQKHLSEATRVLDAARAFSADDPDALYFIAGLYSRIGQRDMSEQVLQDVVRLDPSHAGANNDLGYSWAEQGKNLQRAESMIRVAIGAEPDNHSFLDSLGWVLYKRGRFNAAREMLDEAVRAAVQPDPVVLDHLGDALYRLNESTEAAKQWRHSQQRLGKNDAERDELKQLRLQLQQKLQQLDAGQPVSVAPAVDEALPKRAKKEQ